MSSVSLCLILKEQNVVNRWTLFSHFIDVMLFNQRLLNENSVPVACFSYHYVFQIFDLILIDEKVIFQHSLLTNACVFSQF